MHEKKQGKFLDGFFWGAVLGGGFAYVLSTKKGRDFLKDVIQSGIDSLENATAPEPETLEDAPMVEQTAEAEEYAASSPAVEPAEPKSVAHDSHTEEQEVKKTRFFKKSPKK